MKQYSRYQSRKLALSRRGSSSPSPPSTPRKVRHPKAPTTPKKMTRGQMGAEYHELVIRGAEQIADKNPRRPKCPYGFNCHLKTHVYIGTNPGHFNDVTFNHCAEKATDIGRHHARVSCITASVRALLTLLAVRRPRLEYFLYQGALSCGHPRKQIPHERSRRTRLS